MADRSLSRSSLASAGAACVIRKSDLSRIRGMVATEGLAGHTTGGRKRAPTETAAQRRARMIALDEQNLKLRATSGAADAETVAALERDLAPKIEQHDVAKTMRSYAARAEALAGRKQQVAEKEKREAAEKAEDAKYHAVMMARRELEMLEAAAAEEARRRERYKVAAQMKQQREARAMTRVLDAERTEQEGYQLRISLEAQERAEQAKAAKRREAARATMAVMKIQNESAMVRRERFKQMDYEEDMKMIAYQQAKAKQEREAELKAEAEKAEMARIHHMLLAAQEKVMDTRGEEDEARGRAHEEERVLADRAKDQRKVDARLKRLAEIKVSLEEQKALRRARVEAEKREEAAQVAIFHQAMADASDADARKQIEIRNAAARNQAEVRRQMALNALKSKDHEKVVMEERKAAVMRRRAEDKLVKDYQKGVLGNLAKRGVEGDYTRDVAHMKYSLG